MNNEELLRRFAKLDQDRAFVRDCLKSMLAVDDVRGIVENDLLPNLGKAGIGDPETYLEPLENIRKTFSFHNGFASLICGLAYVGLIDLLMSNKGYD